MPSISVIGLFCEDIREEKSGQDTLVGVLPDSIHVEPLPGLIPKLGLYVRIHTSPDFDLSTPMILRVIHTDGRVLIENRIDEGLKKSVVSTRGSSDHPYFGFIQKALMSPLPVTKDGRITAQFTIGDRTQVCASLGIVKAPAQASS